MSDCVRYEISIDKASKWKCKEFICSNKSAKVASSLITIGIQKSNTSFVRPTKKRRKKGEELSFANIHHVELECSCFASIFIGSQNCNDCWQQEACTFTAFLLARWRCKWKRITWCPSVPAKFIGFVIFSGAIFWSRQVYHEHGQRP